MNPELTKVVQALEEPEVQDIIHRLATYNLSVCVMAPPSDAGWLAPNRRPRTVRPRLPREENPRICFDRIISDGRGSGHREALVAAAVQRFGVENERELFHDIDPSQPLDIVRLALINGKRWEVGSTLKCRFLEGSQVQRERVVEKARIWEQYANIHIDFVNSADAQVRIAFTPGQGSWSAIGTDALDNTNFPANQPTMNYGWLEDNTDDTEYERVVVHEFGHALGALHEHQQPKETLKWNRDAVYTYFSGPPNYWSKEEIDFNVLEKYSSKGVTATVFDPHSIMLYQFPGYLFTDGKGTPNNTHLSEKDKQLIAQMYPS